jgi:hypothetical protein
MAKLRVLLRCIGAAVCVKAPRALLSLVPLGEYLYDVAEETYRLLRASGREADQVAAIAAAAGAGIEETRQEAQGVVEELALAHSLPPEAQINLVSYLSQVPSVVRQTLKRPSDPAGKTVPATFSLRQHLLGLTMLPQRLPSLKAGDRCGNWELVELLGAGGFGEVWLARHPSLHGLKAALKFCLDPAAASTLRHEAALLDRVMQQGRHPGIVPLRQAYLDREPLCLEYEYINGGDLSALLAEWQRGGKIPRRQVNRIVLRLAEIIAHAHTLHPPIVHRDLKPANILVERSPDSKLQLRVTDFGIGGIAAAQSLHATRRGTTTRGQQLSTSLRGSHTPIYASPQQVRGEAPDPRDDVHALGIIWYQLLTGDLTAGIPADWTTVLEDLGQPDPLIRLLGACVASRPEKRLANALALVEQLTDEVEERVLEAIPVVVAEPAVPPVARIVPPPVTRPAPPPVDSRLGTYQGQWFNMTWGGSGWLVVKVLGIDAAGGIKAQITWTGGWNGSGHFGGTILDNGSLNMTGVAAAPDSTWDCHLTGVLAHHQLQGQYTARWKSNATQNVLNALGSLFNPMAQVEGLIRQQPQTVTFSLAKS